MCDGFDERAVTAHDLAGLASVWFWLESMKPIAPMLQHGTVKSLWSCQDQTQQRQQRLARPLGHSTSSSGEGDWARHHHFTSLPCPLKPIPVPPAPND